MSNFNYCERTGQVLPEDFVTLLTRECIALKVAETFRSKLPVADFQLNITSSLECRYSEDYSTARKCAQKLVSGECELYSLAFSDVYDSDSRELVFEIEVAQRG